MPQNAFFSTNSRSSGQPKNDERHFLPTLHPLSTVIFATATVLAFVLLRNSNFNFHCYTQRVATPTQKSARKYAATSRDFFAERLQSAFTLANQLRCIAQQHLLSMLYAWWRKSFQMPARKRKQKRLNPFTASACTISRLKSAHIIYSCKQYI